MDTVAGGIRATQGTFSSFLIFALKHRLWVHVRIGSNVYPQSILKRKSFATVSHPFLLQYGPCEGILKIISYVPAQ